MQKILSVREIFYDEYKAQREAQVSEPETGPELSDSMLWSAQQVGKYVGEKWDVLRSYLSALSDYQLKKEIPSSVIAYDFLQNRDKSIRALAAMMALLHFVADQAPEKMCEGLRENKPNLANLERMDDEFLEALFAKSEPPRSKLRGI